MQEQSTHHDGATVRIVFDGAPFAGKTTAMKTLGSALGQQTYSPLEFQGRTAWFDWTTYTGGNYEGKPVRVEAVTVPGQLALDHRRRFLIDWADVVAFVADTSPEGVEPSVAKFASMQRLLGEVGDRPVIILANKRDVDGALPLNELTPRLGAPDTYEVVECVASAGRGVRQAFIYAVRAGLRDRPDSRSVTSWPELLAQMIDTLRKDAPEVLRTTSDKPDSPFPRDPFPPPDRAEPSTIAQTPAPSPSPALDAVEATPATNERYQALRELRRSLRKGGAKRATDLATH